MSIINDAIKKARREFEIKVKKSRLSNAGPAAQTCDINQAATVKSSETRWTAVLVISLVLIASLLGSLVFYKHMSGLNAPYKLTYKTLNLDTKKEQIPVVSTERPAPIIPRANSLLELNGIVYGPNDKWAIINNRIAREGDAVLNGTLTMIEKNFVKVRKNNGEEALLELR